jgi:hypothetical protein
MAAADDDEDELEDEQEQQEAEGSRSSSESDEEEGAASSSESELEQEQSASAQPAQLPGRGSKRSFSSSCNRPGSRRSAVTPAISSALMAYESPSKKPAIMAAQSAGSHAYSYELPFRGLGTGADSAAHPGHSAAAQWCGFHNSDPHMWPSGATAAAIHHSPSKYLRGSGM